MHLCIVGLGFNKYNNKITDYTNFYKVQTTRLDVGTDTITGL